MACPRAVFANCGQVCLNTERVYVERPIYDDFVEALKAKAEGFRRGDPFDKATNQGPLISQEHRDKVMGYYERGQQGRQGGDRRPDSQDGRRLRPMGPG